MDNPNKKVLAVSFDLWLTLIKSNPEFKQACAKIWQKELGGTIPDILKVQKSMKDYFTSLDEITGRHSTMEERMFFMYSLAQVKIDYKIFKEKITLIYSKIEEAFLTNLPSLYDSDTKLVLEELNSKGIFTSIISNTGIVKGYTLNKALQMLGISNLFSFKIWSDEYKYAKPNPILFNMVLYHPKLRALDSPEQILHIGDNPYADGGCTANKMQFLQINSNENTIKKVLEYV